MSSEYMATLRRECAAKDADPAQHPGLRYHLRADGRYYPQPGWRLVRGPLGWTREKPHT